MSQVTTNCHYVTRSLTRAWEMGQRRLRYYDFERDAFDEDSSYSLFAEDRINTQEVETWLDRTIENPLGAARKRIGAADPKALDEWKFYRAAVLMLWLQGVRVKSIVDEDRRESLRMLAAMPMDQLDALVLALREEYDLRLVFTQGRNGLIAPLYFPSSGLFYFVFGDTGCLSGHSISIGLPLEQHCALVATPSEQHGKLDLTRLSDGLSNYSIGTSSAKRVVLPPGAFETLSKEELRSALREQRDLNDNLLRTVREKHQLVIDAFAEFGLVPERGGSGRIRRPKV